MASGPATLRMPRIFDAAGSVSDSGQLLGMESDHDSGTRPLTKLRLEIEEARVLRASKSEERDFPFDEYLNLPEQEQLRLFAMVVGALYEGNERVPSKAVQARMAKVVGCVVANAIVAMNEQPADAAVYYSRANTTYSSRSPYYPEWMSSRLLKKAIDSLANAGLLISNLARPTLVKTDSRRSTFALSQEFVAQLTEIGVDRQSVQRDDESAPVVFLKKGELTHQKYDPRDPAVVEKIAFLRAYNANLREQHLGVRGEGPPLTAKEERKNRIYRHFKNSFQEHGRFYGGWWQGTSAARRASITINDEATVELDYASFHPRLLYHLQGCELECDAYDIPEIMEAAANDGMDWAEVRPVVKAVFCHMLNSKRRGGYQRSEAFDGWPPSLSRKDGIALIERRHKGIAKYFYSGQSLSLMNLDSEICELVLRCGLHDGVVILPVHDSFIVQAEHEEWLSAVMDEAYAEITGRYPVIT